MQSLVNKVVLVACALLAVAGTEASAQGQMNRETVERMSANWPKASREAAMYLMDKYGAPQEMTASMAMWGKAGVWKRTIVYNYEVQHNFPGPHTDVMQQWIDYRMDGEDADDITEYDGSVVYERTNGEMSARCDKEAANFLAINLAHEIAMKKRNKESARTKYGQEIMKMKKGEMTAYTSGLMFTPAMGGTADPDKPIM